MVIEYNENSFGSRRFVLLARIRIPDATSTLLSRSCHEYDGSATSWCSGKLRIGKMCHGCNGVFASREFAVFDLPMSLNFTQG